MNAPDPSQPPNRIPWPPLLVLGTAAAALVLSALVPPPGGLLRLLPLRLTGAAIIAAGLGFDGAAMVTMARRRANILPHRAATALVTTGPFALSRNPIYLGNTLLVVGVGLAFAAPWFLAAALLQAWLVTRLAITREEAHLAATFGADWTRYAARTPRWLRLR